MAALGAAGPSAILPSYLFNSLPSLNFQNTNRNTPLIDTYWLDSVSPIQKIVGPMVGQDSSDSGIPGTIAAFSPANIAGSSLASRQRSTVIVHRKSPLLVATPPPVTRALAYAHPYLLPILKLLGLLTWTGNNAWESYLLVASFWGIVLHGDVLILWAGPLMVICGLIIALNSTSKGNWRLQALTDQDKIKKKKNKKEMDSVHHKSLDEIVDTLRDFTTKCNIFFEPLLEMMDFIVAQQEATVSTVRPATTVLLTRILYLTPLWILLSLPPLYIITARRVVLVVGTIILTWHSRPARILRIMLWRSLAIRQFCSLVTGLNLISDSASAELVPSYTSNPAEPSFSFAKRRTSISPGVRFTFILYENQRKWIGLGWTTTLFSNERTPWTDEHLNPAPSTENFELPDVKNDNARWRWVPGSEWTVEVEMPKKLRGGKSKESPECRTDAEGWIYYDNKWHDCRGEDGWSRYTRRRKWCRNAELVEVASGDSHDVQGTQYKTPSSPDGRAAAAASGKQHANDNELKNRKKRWFSGGSGERSSDSPSALLISVNEKQFMHNRDSDLTAAYSAKTDIKEIHEKHMTDLRDLHAKAAASKKSMLQKHSPRRGDITITGDNRPSHPRSLRSKASMEGSSGIHHDSRRVCLRSSRSNLRSGADTDTGSPARSLRDQELELERDLPDQWGPHAVGPSSGIQRAPSQWALSDDAEMGLS
ncbi:peroxisome- protein [Ascosphaera aggregata]|nr:peroxisome- protein [Ascosphaera aggregata]